MTKHDPDRNVLVFEAIVDFTTTYGHPPSVRDILARVGLASTAAVHYHLRKLAAAGALAPCACGCGRYRVAA